jgi:hypothetical protein
MVDNFDEIRKHLDFKSDFDRYIVHVIKRAKDENGKKYGVNETNRLLKTFYITSVEYFDKKIPVIRDLCDSNSARAYILPQVRNNEDCLRNLLKVVVDNLSNPTIKPDHLIRTAYCGNHCSRAKRWILDLDNDNMIERGIKAVGTYGTFAEKKWTVEEVMLFVKEQLKNCGKENGECFVVPTVHGHCLVTEPFDLQKAYNKCSMMFQGVTRRFVDVHWTGPGEYENIHKNVNGWLIKDGMVLMYKGDGNE